MNPKHVGVVEIYSTNESVVSRQTQKGGVRNISARLDISIYSRLPNRTTIPLTYQVIRRSIGMTNRINFVGTRTPRWIKLIPIASARNVEMLFADTFINTRCTSIASPTPKNILSKCRTRWKPIIIQSPSAGESSARQCEARSAKQSALGVKRGLPIVASCMTSTTNNKTQKVRLNM